ncbi:MAG: hypothetical protein IKV35_01390, partial [Clostridia bacterium]|nr:hypothetical protein [Clostridia bacterium]
MRVFCHRNGYEYRVDSSNADLSFSRNRIRKFVVPQLREVNECAVENILRMAKTLREEEEYLHRLAQTAVSDACIADAQYRVASLCECESVIRRRALRIIAENSGCDFVEHRHVCETERLLFESF